MRVITAISYVAETLEHKYQKQVVGSPSHVYRQKRFRQRRPRQKHPSQKRPKYAVKSAIIRDALLIFELISSHLN